MTRGLIEECGIEPEYGAHLYRTTWLFLEKMGAQQRRRPAARSAPFLPDNVNEIDLAQN